MLQPRLSSVCGSANMRNFGGFGRMGVLAVCFALLFSATLVSCQDVHVNDEDSIEATRIKREGAQENRDLTVLLVNDQKRPGDYNSKIGRYHSVKPLIGLLTSTARTFIQDGVTTEFATQILGTTLDNGRIYAQLLTKSSLVLYNKPSNVDDSIVVKPTKSNFDGKWNVKQDLGFIDPEKFVLKNTDYLAPNSKMDIVFASKPAPDNVKYWVSPSSPESYSDNQILEEPVGRKVVQASNEIPRYDAFNFLDGPKKDTDKKFVVNPAIIENVNTLHRQSKAYDVTPEVPKVESRFKDVEFNESNVVKVKPGYDLPTFTIKNEFSPIFYYIDNVESRGLAPQAGMQTKLPKKLFGQKSEPRPKKTFTYAGFADFTTVVGDTVIVFTPNTDIAQEPIPGQVNVFPSANKANNLATKITFLAADIPVATSTYKAHEAKLNTKLTTPNRDENKSEKPLYHDEESLKKIIYEVDKMPDAINVQYNHGFDLNLDVIQPSEAVTPSTESSRITDDLGVVPVQGYNAKATEPLNTLKPSATIIEAPKESVVTESDVNDFTNSEEEWENTAEEVTEKDSEETTSTNEEEEILTTTENGTIDDDSEEDIDVTTEGYNSHDSEEVFCTKGLETRSTMTTAYKTLTYLTTYFIPLEGTETTTSVKSDVVVESNSGYLTNVVCKTDLNIEPTAVISVSSKSLIQSSLDKPENDIEETTVTPNEEVKDEVVTEKLATTIQVEQELTTVDDEPETVEQRLGDNTSEEKDKSTNTTTERMSTTQSHVEVSVNTEKSTTTTEKPTTENDTQEEINASENEIDLIYKTLYTTYTYFTTFFGDSTSSVASHKSVVTNIITSTVNLNNVDPSLLGEFNDDEIAPTSVGIGRPTESYNPVNSIIELVKNQNVIDSVESEDTYSSRTPTPSLGDDLVASIKPDGVKTYFTTYTFFTTIYVGSDANVCSRSEVYTNYVGPEELIPTKTNLAENTKAQFDFRNCKQLKNVQLPKNDDTSSMESSISTEETSQRQSMENIKKGTTPNPSPVEVDMLFSVESNPLESDSSYVTDVKSSSSKGEQKYLENNYVLEDQVSSESNIDEIMPSPTLLLQTSYTTFTYFTTMYIGKDSSKVKSRLETITNVVTETITPKKEPEVEESNLPITYYTTFTYWTTLYRDKSTTITSREEIVSNVVTPTAQLHPTVSVSPIDTTPIDIDSVLPPKDLEVELKPSLIDDSLESDDGKATFYTTYTYFTTFYVGNTSQIRSSLETVTNIVDNTKLVNDNQLGRKVPTGPSDKNLVQDDKGSKNKISPSVVKEDIKATKLPDMSAGSPTVLLGTYIDNLFAEVKPDEKSTPKPDGEKKILYSQVAVISGDSTVITNDNNALNNDGTSITPFTSPTTEGNIIVPTPDVIESSEADSSTEKQEGEEEEEDDGSSRKKSRLTFTTKKPTFTPVIRPFASRNRPTFSPKRVPALSSATIITRSDFTPTITATPALKSVRPSGFGANRKQSAFPGSSSSSRRFSGRSSIASLSSANVPVASRSGGFNRPSIQPTSRRTGFRTSSLRSSSIDFANRSAAPRIRPTASSRLRGGKKSASVSQAPIDDLNESETFATQQEESVTEPLDQVTEAPVKTTNNPLLRFRRPLSRQPGTAVTPRSTTQTTQRKTGSTRGGRVTTTTRRPTTRSTTNPLLSLKRQRPNALFPRRNLFREPEPQPEEEIKENEPEVDDDENDEILEGDDLEVDNDYESSNRKEQQISTPSTQAPRRISSPVQIRPFRKRSKRQVDYGSRTKYSNFRRPGPRTTPSTRRSDDEVETEAPTSAKPRTSNRYRSSTNKGTTTSPTAVTRSSSRQPFIIRGESRSTTSTPAYRNKNTRPSSRSTTSSSRPKAPRLQSYNSQTTSRSNSRSSSARTRTRGSTRANSRQRNSFESSSGERLNYNHLVNDGKITVTHQIPIEVTIPVVNGKITEYKQVLTAKPSLQTLLLNQVSTSLGPLGNQQLILATEATELADNGATKIIKFLLHETPTSTVVFTPTTIRGRRTSYSHILPSTVYNVEPITSTITPEISANVPLANLLLSQLLLGNQQPAINPLLALQGQGLLPQQPVVQTPVTEYKIRTTTYVTTVTDARETVLPITFRGIPILTTIKDPTINVITATEYITDTLVTTPTLLPQQQPQFNSLLLPLLLQQQQQQQQLHQQALQTPNPLLGLGMVDLSLVHNNHINNDIYSNSPKPNILSDLASNEDFADESQDYDSGSKEDSPPPPPPPRPKNKPRLPKPAPPKITSVVTLYVSGRTPGEFSTVLSTVVSDDTQTVRKREAIYYEEVKVLPSMLPTVDELIGSQSDDVFDNSIIADSESFDASSVESQIETQSLESIVGELNKHIRYDASPTYVVKLVKPSLVKQTLRSENVS